MRCRGFLVATLLLTSVPLEAQFGGLTKVLDKVQKLSSLRITQEDEVALGEAVSDRIRQNFGVVQDEEVTRYVSLVGLVLAKKSKRSNLPFRFFVLDSDSVNAFAAPGGLIHITRGALASMNDEAELAGVLGHEIAHVVEKHSVEAMQKMKGIELAEGQTNLRENSQVFDKVADEVYQGMLQGFSRKEETKSDELGVRAAVGPGYDPNGLVRFLHTLRLLYQGESERVGLFSSHPETQDRIKKVESQISKKKMTKKGSITLPDRFNQFVKYELVPELEEELSVEGARGVTAGKQKEGQAEKKRQSRFSLAKLKNPLDTREEKKTSQVSGAGGARGVDPRREEETGPKNPSPVEIKVTEDDLQRFKEEGQLK